MTSTPASDFYVKLNNARYPIDIKLLTVVACCMAFGLVMVGSASSGIATANYGDPFYFLIRQTVFMFVGVLAMATMMAVPMHVYERWGSWRSFYLLVC